MDRELRFRSDAAVYRCVVPPIFGAMGGCPPPVSPPVSPPPPPGEPHLIGASPGTTASMWVSGALLRFRSGDGNEYGQTGVSRPTPPAPTATPRSIWVDTTSHELRYVDDSGVHRAVSLTNLGAKPPSSLDRSLWYEAGDATPRTRIRWVSGTNFYKWHNGF